MMIAARDPAWDGSAVEKLGDRVRRLRLEKGLTQDDLARLIGKKFLTINLIENHKTEHPKSDTIEALARELGTTSDYLLRGDDPAETSYEPLDDESRPLVDRLLTVRDDFSAAKKAWIRARLEETQRLDGDDPDRVWQDIRDLATVYEYETGRRLPLPGHETVVAEPRESGDGVMVRPRNKKPKR